MANLTLIQAVNDGLKTSMRDDPSVLVFGEDVGPKGGVFLATEGLTNEFGAERCFDTPLSEDGIVGTAVGMAMNGLPRDEARRLRNAPDLVDGIAREFAWLRDAAPEGLFS